MTRYTGEFLAALRQRYEETDQPMRPLALEFGIGISTLSAIVERERWVKRSQRKRGRPEATLVSEAQALMASLPGRGENFAMPVDPMTTPSPTLPLAGGGSPALGGGLPFQPALPNSNLTAAERLEALLVKEIEAEEGAREALGKEPRLRAEADACTRRLAIMTQTLQTLQKIRETQPLQTLCPNCASNNSPEDINERREQLARRINAFFESRRDEESQEEAEATAAPEDRAQ